jgi:hypothetical protein
LPITTPCDSAPQVINLLHIALNDVADHNAAPVIVKTESGDRLTYLRWTDENGGIHYSSAGDMEYILTVYILPDACQQWDKELTALRQAVADKIGKFYPPQAELSTQDMILYGAIALVGIGALVYFKSK